MYYPKKIKLLVILKEAPNHGDVVDGEGEVVVDGVDGDESAVLPMKLLLMNLKM